MEVLRVGLGGQAEDLLKAVSEVRREEFVRKGRRKKVLPAIDIIEIIYIVHYIFELYRKAKGIGSLKRG